jgi:glutathione synthetase
MSSILLNQKTSKRSLTLNKSFVLSLTFHTLLIFGVTFTTFYKLPLIENSPIINVKFANSSQDSFGNVGQSSTAVSNINESQESLITKESNRSVYQAQKIKKLEANSLVSTEDETAQIVVQEFLPEIYKGDFRILIIHGKPFKKTLARIPQGESFKGNLAAGGKGVVKDINENQKKVAEKVGKFLLSKGINFAGIDMIGDYLTEINITSPTCAREIFDQSGKNPIDDYLSGL